MKTRGKLCTRLVLIAFAVVALCIALSFTAVTYAESTDPPFTIEDVYDECKALTSSDVLDGAALLNGLSPTIKDYIKYAKNGKYDSDMVLQNDHLWRIIPKELFKHVGMWFYQGDAYSFFIRSWNPINNDKD